MRTLAENARFCDFIPIIIMHLLCLLLLLMPHTSLWIWTVGVGASMVCTSTGTNHRITLTTKPALLAHAQTGTAPSTAIQLKSRRRGLHHTQMGSKTLWIGKDEAAGITFLS
jgi:hypothetical protein